MRVNRALLSLTVPLLAGHVSAAPTQDADGKIALSAKISTMGEKGPAQGIAVELGFVRGSDRHQLDTAITDAEGVYRFERPLPEGWDPDQAWLYVSVAEPGYQRWHAPFRDPAAGFSAQGFTASPGTTITGSVVGPDGIPVDATVVATVLDGKQAKTWGIDQNCFEVKTRPNGFDRGFFEISFERPVTCELVAFQEDKGTAVIQRLEVDGSDSFIPLVLEGSGTLSGSLHDAFGNPVIGARVSAALALDNFTGQRWDPDGASGLCVGNRTTDEDGSFHFAGLLPGSYRLTASLLPQDCFEQLALEPVATGTSDLDLTLSRYVVRVLALTPNGEILPPEDTFCHVQVDPQRALAQDAPDGDNPPFSALRRLKSTERGEAQFAVAPGQQFVIGHFSEDQVVAETFTVAHGQFTKEIVLQAGGPDSIPAGRLRIEDTPDAHGRPVLQLELHSFTAGQTVRTFAGSELPFESRLPADTYALFARYSGRGLSCMDDPAPPQELAISCSTLVVSPGETTIASVPGSKGGRLALTLRYPPGDSYNKIRELLRRDDELGTNRAASILWGDAKAFVLEDLSPWGFRRRIHFWDPKRAAPVVPGIDQEYVSWELFPAGLHALHLQVPGFREVTLQRTFVEGEVTRVEVELEP
jgi:hypothetical protein